MSLQRHQSDCNEIQPVAGVIEPGQERRIGHTFLAKYLNPNPRKFLHVTCIGLLVFWGVWWCLSFHRQELQACKHLWVTLPAFGCDFYRHVDRPARIWSAGGDPYADQECFFAYPPSEMRLFAWVNYMTPRTALMVWLIFMTGLIAAAAWVASRWRRGLSLDEISPLAAIVLMLFSTPVLFAMERGQYDPLSLLPILAALPLLKHKSGWAQFLAGAILCVAPWVKAYPGLIAVGLIGLRRWRALAAFAVVGIVVALLDFAQLQKFFINNNLHIQKAEDLARMFPTGPCLWNHPLAISISCLWLRMEQFQWLGLLPGKIIAAGLLFVPLAWVTYHVYRSPARDKVAYPYLLWIVALATFVPPISNDYNLCFLPLAVLAVWNRRDPLLIQLSLGLLFLWWQPISISTTAYPILAAKLLGLYATGICVVERAYEQAALSTASEEQDDRTASKKIFLRAAS